MCLTPSPSAASREKASHGELAESRGDQETLPGFHLESRREPSAPEQRPDRGTRDVRRARAEPFSAFPLFRAACQSGGSPARNDAFRGLCDSVDLFFEREKAPVQTTAGWFTVGRPTRRFQTFFVFFLFRVCSFSSLAQKASGSRAGPTLTVHKTPFEFAAPPSFPSLTSCIGPTTACGTKLRLCL